MSKSIIVEGKTSTEAIEKGLKELNVKKEQVDIRILEESKRSFYSILAPRVVKVELTLKENYLNTTENEVKEKKNNFCNDINEIKNSAKKIEEFLNNILSSDVKKSIEVKDFCINVQLSGENINYLIGYRGETINALQVILTAIANKNASSKTRILVDVGGYKEKREKTLKELAEKIAKTVIRTKKPITLEPMTAYERKIIHKELQSNDKVKTHSKGEEPHRRIVISLKKE